MPTDREVRQSMIGTVLETQRANGKQPSVEEAEKFLQECHDVALKSKARQDHAKPRVYKKSMQEQLEERLPEGQEAVAVLHGSDVTRARQQVRKKIGKQPRMMKSQSLDGIKAALFAQRIKKLTSTYTDVLTGRPAYTYPDWEARLRNAYNNGARIAWREEYSSFEEMQNFKIQEVVELSGDTFGRWDHPKERKLVFGG